MKRANRLYINCLLKKFGKKKVNPQSLPETQPHPAGTPIEIAHSRKHPVIGIAHRHGLYLSADETHRRITKKTGRSKPIAKRACGTAFGSSLQVERSQ